MHLSRLASPSFLYINIMGTPKKVAHLSVNTFYNSVLYKAKIKFTILGKCVYANKYSRLICSWRRSINSEIKKFKKVKVQKKEQSVNQSLTIQTTDHIQGRTFSFLPLQPCFGCQQHEHSRIVLKEKVFSPDSLKYCIEAQE